MGDSAKVWGTSAEFAEMIGAWVRRLLCFVGFEESAGFFEGEGVAVDLEFVFASVFGDGDDMADGVAILPESSEDQIDVYHG
jgi:hypothetical protein